jgi:putative membrane protein
MIRSFTDQAANERTFLAWIRTGIAVIAFGFVVEKFNLFVLALAAASNDVAQRLRAERLADPLAGYEGRIFIFVGLALIVLGSLRFARNSKRIADIEMHEPGDARLELVTASALILLVSAYWVSIFLR